MRTMKFVGLALFLTLLMACNKDEDPSDCAKLEGTWQGESWLEDDEEFLGADLVITSSEIEFKTLTDDQGDYEWNIGYALGGPELVIGAYVVNDDCDQVTLTPKDGAPTTYNFRFEDDFLFLEGLINNVDISLKFSKE